jgi:UPF0755 protein
MKKKLLIAAGVLVVLGLVAAGAGYWIAFSGNTADFEGERGVKIPRGTNFSTVLDSLEGGGILGSRQRMQWFNSATGLRGAEWGNYLDGGYYRFAEGASNYDILGKIYRGEQSAVQVTIPPGSRPEVIAAVTARDMDFEKKDFLAALDSSALAQELGTDTTSLFGYLMPNTYSLKWVHPPSRVIKRAKRQFDRFWTEARAARADSLGLSKQDVVTLASIVQWETSLQDELPRVSGVYLNRLQEGMRLQADPTVQYAILEKEGQKRRVLYEDLEMQHPYNTYQIPRLPPGPITNPSEAVLESVLDAEQHDYLYFVATGDGGHNFNETLQGHNRDANRYRSLMQQRRDSLRSANSGSS